MAAVAAAAAAPGAPGSSLTFAWLGEPLQGGHLLYYQSFQFCSTTYAVGDHVSRASGLEGRGDGVEGRPPTAAGGARRARRHPASMNPLSPCPTTHPT
jgi:hypothetical protein